MIVVKHLLVNENRKRHEAGWFLHVFLPTCVELTQVVSSDANGFTRPFDSCDHKMWISKTAIMPRFTRRSIGASKTKIVALCNYGSPRKLLYLVYFHELRVNDCKEQCRFMSVGKSAK